MINKDISVHLLAADSIEYMSSLLDNTFDMIFADPPYNLQLSKDLYRPEHTKVKGVDHEWDQFSSLTAYDEFTFLWLSEAKRVLRDSGSIWVMGSYHNIYRVGYIMQNMGFWILNDIIWHKSNPMPNFKGVRFTNAHEHIIWATTDKKNKYCFNYESMKNLNDDKQMTSVWKFPICSGKERIKDSNGNTAHPTQKPESLLSRIIQASTQVGDTILDPFVGTGTSAAVAYKLYRNAVGIDSNPDYIDLASQRLRAINSQPAESLETVLSLYKSKVKKVLPKVSLGNLIDVNLLSIGDTLFDKDLKYYAYINADGSLTAKNNSSSGSIHMLAKQLESNDNINGWSYWYYQHSGVMMSLDQIRQEYIKKYVKS